MVTALRDDPGLPTSGLIVLCDFGGSGTSITLVDAANGSEQVGQTIRYTELSGDLIDKAVLNRSWKDWPPPGLRTSPAPLRSVR